MAGPWTRSQTPPPPLPGSDAPPGADDAEWDAAETLGADQGGPLDAREFPCDRCGGVQRFDPAAGQLVCQHCGAEQELSAGHGRAGALRELDFEAAIAHRLPEEEIEETRVLNCSNCGAQVEFEPSVHAAECPFCATPVVTDTGTHRHIKPKGVLPFAHDERTAHEAMDKWLGRLWFAPNGLRDYARKGRPMNGIYVPYWTFDADTTSAYKGQRGTVYYVTKWVTVDGKRTAKRVAKVRWTSVRGRVARFFDDVLVLGARSLPKNFADGLPPWDLGALEPYTPQYLAGFRAEAYTVELKDAFVEARAQMDRTIERDVRFDIGGDRQRVHDVQTDVRDVTFKHVLLPVWTAAYRYRGTSYRCLVNGQTGRVQGERPYSAWKIAFAVVLGLIAAVAIGYLLAQSEGAGF